MATVINRTTAEVRRSVNAADYADPPWLHDPDLSGVAGVPQRHIKVTGDVVSEMSQTEKDAVDAALLSSARDAVAAQFDNAEDTFRAFALTVLDELNLHAERITAILDAIDAASSLGDVKTAVAAINDVPQRTIAQMKTSVRNKLGS